MPKTTNDASGSSKVVEAVYNTPSRSGRTMERLNAARRASRSSSMNLYGIPKEAYIKYWVPASRPNKSRIVPEPEEETAKPPTPPVSRPKPLWKKVVDDGTLLIANTANFKTLAELPFRRTMLDAEALLYGLDSEEGKYHAWLAVRSAMGLSRYHDKPEILAQTAVNEYKMYTGIALLDAIEGQHITYVELNVSHNFKKILTIARRIMSKFENKGIRRDDVIISIPATESGIRAVQDLSKEGILTNLTHVVNLVHAAICAEAGATMITFNCEETMTVHKDIYKIQMNRMHPRDHPYIQEIQATIEFFKRNSINCRVAVHELLGSPVIERLKGVSGLALRDSDVKDIQEREASFFGVGSNSLPAVRARETTWPTNHLASVSTTDTYLQALSPADLKIHYRSVKAACDRWRIATQAMADIFKAKIKYELRVLSNPIDLVKGYWVNVMNWNMISQLQAEKWWTQTAVDGAEPEWELFEHIGFRMTTLTWGLPTPFARPPVEGDEDFPKPAKRRPLRIPAFSVETDEDTQDARVAIRGDARSKEKGPSDKEALDTTGGAKRSMVHPTRADEAKPQSVNKGKKEVDPSDEVF
ncbi:hypothetical protein K474DRAFT_1774080 [Panus rudis PR-1116 ss-1]|nr:hypothetical protein K474DRAFT_1774080 [Panus rudis PR-1116 ss-1]